MKKKISIVISLFNEEQAVKSFSKSLISQLTQINDVNFEVVWVNDGSSDKTSLEVDEVAQNFLATNITHVKIDFSKNFGHEAAMIAGIDNANGDAIICMDGDGQHPPKEIPKMIAAFFNGNDYVLMSRVKRQDNGFIKKTLSALFYKIVNSLSKIPFEKNASDFFLISDDIATILKENYREKNRFIRGFIQSMGFTNCTLYFTAPERIHGESRYSYKTLFKLAISAIFTFSFKPLRMSVLFAIFFVIITLSLSVYSIYQYVNSDAIPSGYTTIILFISFSFTLLFSMLAIQLLYFEKLIEEVRHTPIYIIKSKQKYVQ